jgi:hypothetical protein
MIPYQTAAALAASKHSALLAEAQAWRLAEQTRRGRRRTGAAAARRWSLRRSTHLSGQWLGRE